MYSKALLSYDDKRALLYDLKDFKSFALLFWSTVYITCHMHFIYLFRLCLSLPNNVALHYVLRLALQCSTSLKFICFFL